MSFNNATIATTVTPTVAAGTPITFVSVGSTPGVNDLYVEEDTTANLRRTLHVTASQSRVLASAPGGYSQERQTILYKVPMILANGNRTVNTIRIEVSVDPEFSVAARAAMRSEAAQFLFDSDFTPLFEKGNPL